MAEESKKTSCPSCLGQAIKEGNKIICETCDATFTFTKTGGAKVKEIGRLNSLEERMDRFESLLPDQELDTAKLEPDPAANETSILGPD